MIHPLIVFNVVAAEMVCTTTQPTPTATVTTTTAWVPAPVPAPAPPPAPVPAPAPPPAPVPAPAPAPAVRRKRDANQVEVTIVSRQRFDPEMNPSYLKVVEARIEQYAKHTGRENGRNVEGKVRNSGGKFAVVYNLPDAICDKVIDFVKGAKENTDVVEHAAVKCEGRKKVFL